jgi:hypothetical protein
MADSDTDTIYFKAYQSVAHMSHPSSHNFLQAAAVPAGARTLAIKYRMGNIYNQKLAHRYGRAENADCPLCGDPDSQTHMLGGCRHPVMHDIYCKRHNEAAILVLLHLHIHGTPTTPIQTHVGRPASVPTLEDLPDVVPGCRTHHARPDFTLRDTHIRLVEVKYGQDTRLEEKLPGIHNTLVQTKRTAEATNNLPATVHPILIGVGGRIPTSTFDSIVALGATTSQATKICNKLNQQAVTWMHRAVVARRRLHGAGRT